MVIGWVVEMDFDIFCHGVMRKLTNLSRLAEFLLNEVEVKIWV